MLELVQPFVPALVVPVGGALLAVVIYRLFVLLWPWRTMDEHTFFLEPSSVDRPL